MHVYVSEVHGYAAAGRSKRRRTLRHQQYTGENWVARPDRKIPGASRSPTVLLGSPFSLCRAPRSDLEPPPRPKIAEIARIWFAPS